MNIYEEEYKELIKEMIEDLKESMEGDAIKMCSRKNVEKFFRRKLHEI